MGFRDVFTLNFIRMMSSPIIDWIIGMYGPIESEIIVTYNCCEICAQRGNDLLRWQYGTSNDSISVVGCETHSIVVFAGAIKVF